ncbi:hypothetical protein [Streptomyces sp. NPDC055107]
MPAQLTIAAPPVLSARAEVSRIGFTERIRNHRALRASGGEPRHIRILRELGSCSPRERR